MIFPGMKNKKANEEIKDWSTAPVLDRGLLCEIITCYDKSDIEFLSQLIDMFEKDISKNISDIKDFLEASDFENLRFFSHQSKSSCASIGALKLMEVFGALENLIRQELAGNLDIFLEEIDTVYQDTLKELHRLEDECKELPDA